MGRPPCCDKMTVKKGPWTPEEDIILVSYIQERGPGNWRTVPSNAGLLRCSKSCRLRWTNYLRPGIKRGNFTEHEEKIIIHLQNLLGNRWAAIASYLPERTDNDIKNYWNTQLKKKLNKLQQGDDANNQERHSVSESISKGHSNPSEGTLSATTPPEGNHYLFSFNSDESDEAAANFTPENGAFKDEKQQDLNNQMPLTLLEKWLFDDVATQGDEEIVDMSLGETSRLF
ncbi:unnamed protein product [Fraxinus pennsylvanica]|uniref:Myb-like domain-containing protein n=1 Tax=Fraxinus pennsylvanica TaxID=56036 RepID=A0AAD1ZHV7_9LAMI|nr:unnamed protein product [Fraxinus pennsylvanica]